MVPKPHAGPPVAVGWRGGCFNQRHGLMKIRSAGTAFFAFDLQLHSSNRRAIRDPCNHSIVLQLEPPQEWQVEEAALLR